MICIMPMHIIMGTWLTRIKVGGGSLRRIRAIFLMVKPTTSPTFSHPSLFNGVWWKNTILFQFGPLGLLWQTFIWLVMWPWNKKIWFFFLNSLTKSKGHLTFFHHVQFVVFQQLEHIYHYSWMLANDFND